MKKHLANILKFLISLALGIGLVYWSLKGVTAEQRKMISDSFQRANYGWLSFLIIFGFASNFFRTQRWRLLLKPLGYTPDYWNTFASVMIMFFANLAFPRLGEVLRCSILAKYEKVPVEKSIGTMVLERIVDLISIFILGGIVLLFEFRHFYNFFLSFFLSDKPNANAAAQTSYTKYIVLLCIVLAIVVGAFYMIRKHGWEKLSAAIKNKLKGLGEGIVSIKDLENKWEFLFHTIMIWVCYILMPYFSFKCLNETSHLGVIAAMANVFFGGFAMVATQGGIGAFQIVTQKVLATYGIAAIIGLSYGWISWSVQTVFVIFGGILSLVFLALYNKESEMYE
ncbi:MAG: hypothetical protein JWN78_482 [Bacteroidota bacterium]|nr:hypothetical protein [Bacteroidota bacterium]